MIMKKTSKKILMLSALLVMTIFSPQRIQASELQGQKNVIQANGKATIKVAPDIATINAVVRTQNKDAKKAQEKNAETISKIKKEVSAKYLLEEKDINTIYYRVRPAYDYIEGKQVFRHYVVEHTLAVTVKDISKVGEMVDALVESGATTVDQIHFGLIDENVPYHLALQKALANAQEKANAMTASLGVGQATPIAIREQSESQGLIQDQNMIMQESMDSAAGSKTIIHQSDIEITARIQVTFQW